MLLKEDILIKLAVNLTHTPLDEVDLLADILEGFDKTELKQLHECLSEWLAE